MKLSEFEDRVNINYTHNAHWRYGQSWFNTLHMLFPEEADKIRGTNIDPFHIDVFVRDLREHLLAKGVLENE